MSKRLFAKEEVFFKISMASVNGSVSSMWGAWVGRGWVVWLCLRLWLKWWSKMYKVYNLMKRNHIKGSNNDLAHVSTNHTDMLSIIDRMPIFVTSTFSFIMGASTVKDVEKVLWYTETINFLVKRLKVVAKLFNLDFFHGALYCCVMYSNIEYQDGIFKSYH